MYKILKNEADLMKFSMQTAKCVRENISDFSSYGIALTDADRLENLVNDYHAIKPNKASIEQVRSTTKTTNELRATLTGGLSDLAFAYQLEQKRGANYPLKIVVSKYVNLSIAKFLSETNILLETMALAPELKDFVLANSDLIQSIRTVWAELSEKISNLRVQLANRKTETRERKLLANSIRKLNSELCFIGKHIYRKTDPIKYDSFVVYRGPKLLTPIEDVA